MFSSVTFKACHPLVQNLWRIQPRHLDPFWGLTRIRAMCSAAQPLTQSSVEVLAFFRYLSLQPAFCADGHLHTFRGRKANLFPRLAFQKAVLFGVGPPGDHLIFISRVPARVLLFDAIASIKMTVPPPDLFSTGFLLIQIQGGDVIGSV